MTASCIPTIHFRDNPSLSFQQVFPEEIECDDWVLFHGTSSTNSASIESDGLHSRCLDFSFEDLQQILAVYEKLNWAGEDGGGFGVLKGFALSGRWNDSGTRNHYFAETSNRALLYSSLDFAGGETMRSVRRSISDLNVYLTDPGCRERHHQYLSLFNAAPQTDLDWLEKAFTALSPLAERASKAQEEFEHGVIYALRFTREDLAHLTSQGGGGIATSTPISPSKIVAKAIIPRDFSLGFRPSNGGPRFMQRLERGLIHELEKR